MVKTRFAPSPTGYLHIGGARTALFNWLYSRHSGGKFVLRIEDTDQLRSTEENTKAILEGLLWLGLRWDEGPYLQSERVGLYREYAGKLVETGHAYYCTCTPEELQARRERALAEGRKPKYDGTCRDRDLGPGSGRVVRFRTPQAGETVVHDRVQGPVTFRNEELDDLVILRAEGWPTYNFSVVVDDITMEITCVLRGVDHLNNTPRQILIYQALGCDLPEFAHVPLILGSDSKRLSKRHGAVSIQAYQESGYLPDAMVNFLVRLGWSHGDQEIFTLEELIEKFSLDKVGKSSGIFNAEKLLAINAHYIRQKDPQSLAKLIRPILEARGFQDVREAYLQAAAATLREKGKTLMDLVSMGSFYFKQDVEYDPKAVEKYFKPGVLPALEEVVRGLREMPHFDPERMERIFRDTADRRGLKLVELAQPVRVALTGSAVSPGLFEMMEVIGREEVFRRIEKALELIREKEQRQDKTPGPPQS